VRQRRQEHETHAGRRLLDRIQKPVIVGAELREAGVAVERTRHAVAEEDHGRLCLLDLLHELAPAFVRGFTSRLQQAQPEARITGRRVAAPPEIAEGDVAVGKPRGQHGLHPTARLFAFDQRVAEQHHAIAGAKFERRRGLGGVDRNRGKKERDQGQQDE
jgi:hypothetical protein